MNQKIVFTVNLYFGQINIIKFGECLFASVEVMNLKLIKRWNENVSSRERLYHLVDISLVK
jgi:calcineurin-like phosphoesterase family protein